MPDKCPQCGSKTQVTNGTWRCCQCGFQPTVRVKRIWGYRAESEPKGADE